MKKMNKKILQCQRGAALLMVLLVSAFVITVGSSVMFTSYNGYMIQLVDRTAQGNFYTTEEGLDSVLIEVQKMTNSALIDAYNDTLSNYGFWFYDFPDDIDEKSKNEFVISFLEEMEATGLIDTNGYTSTYSNYEFASSAPDFTSVNSSSWSYDTSVLDSVLGVDTSIFSGYDDLTPANTTGNIEWQFNDVTGKYRMVLKDVTVAQVLTTDSGDSYTSYITADIVIEMPDFAMDGSITTGGVLDTDRNEETFGIPFHNAASVGRLWVKTSTENSGEELLVTGDIYGGAFFTYNENNSNSENIIFSHGGGRLITHIEPIVNNGSDDIFGTGTLFQYSEMSGIQVNNGTVFSTRNDSEIWTSSIYGDSGSDILLTGFMGTRDDVYTSEQSFGGVNVAGDLVLQGDDFSSGNKSYLTLGGDYFGFGNGGSSSSDSAIMFNGNVEWNARDLETLYLAGSTYLNVGRSDYGGEYLTGQSLSGKIDQLAYMIPTQALLGGFTSNPAVLTSASDVNASVDTNYALWDGKTIGDYAGKQARVVYYPYSTGDTLVYFLYDFASRPNSEEITNANNYFSDYVTYNNDVFTNNSELFLSMDSVAATVYAAKGNVYYNVGGNGIVISDSSGNNVGNVDYTSTDHRYGTVTTESMSLERAASKRQDDFANASVTLWPDITPQTDSYMILGYYDEVEVGTGASATSQQHKFSLAVPDNPFDYYVDHYNLFLDTLYSINHIYHPEDISLGILNHEIHFRDWQPDIIIDAARGTSIKDLDLEGLQSYINDECGEEKWIYLGKNWTDESPVVNPAGGYYPVGKVLDLWYEGAPVGVFGNSGYRYGVETGKFSQYLDGTRTNSEGLTQTYSNSNSDLVLILAGSGINIYEPFEGLAMSGVGIALIAPMESNADAVNDALLTSWTILHVNSASASATGLDEGYYLKPVISYFRNLYFNATSDGDETESNTTTYEGSTDSTVNWGTNELVYLDNWEKH